MELKSQIGGSVTDGLAYLGGLASLAGRAAYFTFVAPFRGKPLRLPRAVSQGMQVGVRALPILSLITFFIGLILALQSAYELRRLGALTFVANAVAISMTRELGPLITAIVVIGRSGSANAEPDRPMTTMAVISGPSSRVMEIATALATKFMAPNLRSS